MLAGMAKRRNQQRVAIAVTDPASFEGDIVQGAIDYNELAHEWRFVGREGRPFLSFDQIDLTDVDGVITGFYEQRWADAVLDAGVSAVNTALVLANLPLPLVTNDDAATGRIGAEHLLERGFAHFGFIKQGETLYSHHRADAFTEVIEQGAGLRVPHAHRRLRKVRPKRGGNRHLAGPTAQADRDHGSQ
jgi:LacI family transcriptional regulator